MRVEQDYYEVLGVRRDASGDEIKRAFRNLARRLHPDVAAAPVDGFHHVVAAYEVLSHPRRRSVYDRLGLGGRRPPVARPAPAVPPVEIALEWHEATRGVAKAVEFEESATCNECRGLGVPRGVTAADCVRCRGTGRLSQVRESPTLRLLEVRTCPVCEGRGRAAAPVCLDCGGRGLVTRARSVRVRLPAGVRDGDLIEVEGVARRFRLKVAPRGRDSRLILAVAGAALVCALALFLYLTLR